MEPNIVGKTLKRFEDRRFFSEIAKECNKQLKTNIFKAIKFKVGDVIHRFYYFEKRYYQANSMGRTAEWMEDEKKVFLCFLLAFCRLYLRRISQINNNEWDLISKAFGRKDVLILKYQARVLQKCSQRVSWHSEEDLLLKNIIKQNKFAQDIKWSQVSKNLFLISRGQYYKTPKQCSQRWSNYLNKQIQVGYWKINEDIIILQTVIGYGHKWALISDLLESRRTQHMVKNRYYSIFKSFRQSDQQTCQKDQKSQREIAKIIINCLYEKASIVQNSLGLSQRQQILKIQQKQIGQVKQQQEIIEEQLYIQSTFKNPLSLPTSQSLRLQKLQQSTNENFQQSTIIKSNIQQKQITPKIDSDFLDYSIYYPTSLLNSLGSSNMQVSSSLSIGNDIAYSI